MTTILMLLIEVVLASGRPTGVGSGGDDVDRFLKTTREGLVQSLARVRSQNPQGLCTCTDGSGDPFCRYLSLLTPAQGAACREFIAQRLRVDGATAFSLSAQSLVVPDPSGALRPVLAIASPGSIRFHHESIRGLSPMALLALMAHEFGHLSAPEIDDNLPFGPFNKVEGGRLMLDAVGAALARYAADQGLTVQHFGVEDKFACEMREERLGAVFVAEGKSPRHFRSDSLQSYETGIGNWPGDLTCRFEEGGSYLELRMKTVADGPKCRTELELWRVFHGEGPVPLKVLEQGFPDWGPTCRKDDGRLALQFRHGPRLITFRVRYRGAMSQGRLGTFAEYR